jgi:ureidoacrylate peracid hydrolase
VFEPQTVTVDARHTPFTFDPDRTAVIVVDMQNDFASEGGAFVRAGLDVAPIRRAIAPTARVLAAARAGWHPGGLPQDGVPARPVGPRRA